VYDDWQRQQNNNPSRMYPHFYVFYNQDENQMSFHDVGFVGLIVDGSYFSVGYTDFNYNYLIHNWEHECHIIRRLFAVWGLMRIVMK
jgi:hypothetical protein